MYRGVLLKQTGDLERASADHARLLNRDRNLDARFEAVIVRRVTGDELTRIVPQYE